MHRFFVPASAIQDNQIRFSSEQTRQLRTVLRMSADDEVLVLDGRGLYHRVIITHLDKKEALGRIQESLPAEGEPAGDLILYQALTRGDRFEWVLQKGVELGVTLFQPMVTRRTVRRPPGPSKWERWQRIIQEAAEQCGRGRLPALAGPIGFEQAVTSAQGFSLLPTVTATQPARQALSAATWPLHLFIGPEGGFDPEEVALARTAGVHTVTLGARTLRTETAAIVLVTLAMAALDELDRPGPRFAEDDGRESTSVP